MQTTESIPVFRTMTVTTLPSVVAPDTDQSPNRTGKLSLPADMWVDGIATFADAWQHRERLTAGYATALGRDDAGFYVRCPGWQQATATFDCEEMTA